MFEKKYDFVFGIGEACSCSTALRAAHLQIQSFPTDWLSGLDIKGRTALVVSDFQDFFNAEDLKYTGDNKKSDTYVNTRTGITFYHDFPLHSDFTAQYPSVKAKYDKRIVRMLSAIKNARNALIVYMNIPTREKERPADEELISCLTAFEKHFPDTKFDLLYLTNDSDIPYKKRTVEQVRNNLFVVSFAYRPNKKKVSPMAVKKRDLAKFFGQIKVNRTPSDRIKIVLTDFLTFGVKVVSVFILSGSGRRSFRKQMTAFVRRLVWKKY